MHMHLHTHMHTHIHTHIHTKILISTHVYSIHKNTPIYTLFEAQSNHTKIFRLATKKFWNVTFLGHSPNSIGIVAIPFLTQILWECIWCQIPSLLSKKWESHLNFQKNDSLWHPVRMVKMIEYDLMRVVTPLGLWLVRSDSNYRAPL